MSAQRLPAVALPEYAQPQPKNTHRERSRLLDKVDAPHNLRVIDYAKLAGKSRRWISYEIQAGNLLGLSVGHRGMRVPDWHLDPLKNSLIQMFMRQTQSVDAWQLYDALSQPHAQLGGRAPIEAVTYRSEERSGGKEGVSTCKSRGE